MSVREILFRGKRVDNGKWVEGAFIPDALETTQGTFELDGYIKPVGCTKEERMMAEVDRETVSQYTGLTDRNGKRIFEGDIVRVTDDADEVCDHSTNSDTGIGVVEFVCGLWYVGGHDSPNNGLWDLQQVCYIEVIGNIHDDKELLERGRE